MSVEKHRSNKLGHRHSSIVSALPLKDRKILGAERGSLEGGSPPDDRASRASSQHSLSHNIVLLFVNRGKGESKSNYKPVCFLMLLLKSYTDKTEN